MKKSYIQPTIYTKTIILPSIIAGSPKVEEENYNNSSQDDGLNGNLKPGEGTGDTGFGAKQGSISPWFE